MAQERTSAERRRALKQRLESLQEFGLTHLPRGASRLPAATSAGIAPAAPSPAPGGADTNRGRTAPEASSLFEGPLDGPALPAAERAAALQEVAQCVAACTRCAELAGTRTQTVFGVGNPLARLCFLGEAPGADEDAQGEPFVGRAGQLLNRIMEACTLRRKDVYILNVLKCRPPHNRTPTPTEAANCREYLDRQWEIIRPQFICCLGAVAAQNLLGTTVPLGRLRGRFHDYRGMRVLVTYHPAYLLRNPSQKKEVWEDMKFLMAAMGIALPQQ